MPKFKTIRDLNLAGKRVLMRVDINVPQDKTTGAITNNQRIAAALGPALAGAAIAIGTAIGEVASAGFSGIGLWMTGIVSIKRVRSFPKKMRNTTTSLFMPLNAG